MTIGISKIMVGIDGSEQSINAADYAIAIAKRHDAEMIAVNALTSDIGYAYSSPRIQNKFVHYTVEGTPKSTQFCHSE